MLLSKRFVVVPVIIVLFLYLFYSAYKDVRDRTLNEFNLQQFAIAEQASIGIESFFSYYKRELTGLTKLKNVSDLDDGGRNLLTEFYNNHSDQIEAITLVDEKGIIRFSYPYFKGIVGQDISTQKHVSRVMETREATVSDVFTSVQGFRAIAYHIPIISGNNFRGSLAILIPLDKLGERYIAPIKTGKTGYGWLISETGIELFDPIEGRTGRSIMETYEKNQSVQDIFDKTLKADKGTAICRNASYLDKAENQVKTYVAFYRVSLENTFWTILIFTPEKEVYTVLATFRNRLLFLFSLIVAVMVTYFYLSFKATTILKEEKKRKALEIILQESEMRFRTMFELSPAGMILIDDKGMIIEVNSIFCKTLQYTRTELISNNIRLFTLPENESVIKKNISEILAGNTIKQEVRNVRKDGKIIEIELIESMIVLPDGKHGILSVSNDITEKKHSQEKMLTLSRALESVVECVSITDRNNKIIFVNNSFCKTYGYSRNELSEQDIFVVRPGKTTELQHPEILPETIDGGWTGELINVRKDGSEFPIELSTSPIKDEKGEVIALIGIAIDITERKRVQQELIQAKEKAEESDKLKSAFIANMSHEFRTPLNAIIGFSSLMADSMSDKENVSNVKIILDSGLHLLSLVEDILDISKIETGQMKTDYEIFDLNAVLTQVRDIMLGELIRENKTELELTLKTGTTNTETYLFSDKRKLKQVLINLLKNSLKFTEKGQIEFGFTETEKDETKYLKFYVRDSGIGIEKKYQEVIFHNFRQIDDKQTRIYGGMGIGLSIAKRIVEMLEGEIWVESEPGIGSVFYFTIPFKSEKPELTKKSDDEIVKADTSSYEKSINTRKSVLIAEDDISSFEFLKIFFMKMNINVLWAKDGLEAVNICMKEPLICMVMMDIKLPVLNGFEATRRIKKIRPGLPVIAQTAYAMISDKEAAIKAGCDRYLSKPLMQKDLKDLIKEYF